MLEIDITSKTKIEAYQSLKVPEIWRYNQNILEIYVFQNQEYTLSKTSIIFPEISIQENITRFLEMSQIMGTSRTLKAFREWVKTVI